MLKSGFTVYKEIREEAKARFIEIEAYKVRSHKFKVIIWERESGMYDVELTLLTTYVYKNNHTNFATSDNSFWRTLAEGCTKAGAEAIAHYAKKDVEAKTVNKDVEIQFNEYIELEFI